MIAELLALNGSSAGAQPKALIAVDKDYQHIYYGAKQLDDGLNFSFLMDENGEWKLAPAYDLTFSNGPNGEQSTMVMGEGRNPTLNHLVKLGLDVKLPRKFIDEVIANTRHALAQWLALSKAYGVSKVSTELVANLINKRKP